MKFFLEKIFFWKQFFFGKFFFQIYNFVSLLGRWKKILFKCFTFVLDGGIMKLTHFCESLDLKYEYPFWLENLMPSDVWKFSNFDSKLYIYIYNNLLRVEIKCIMINTMMIYDVSRLTWFLRKIKNKIISRIQNVLLIIIIILLTDACASIFFLL